MSNINRRGWMVTFWASMILLLAGCSSEAVEQAQVVSVAPTSVPTTAPLSAPTPTSTPEPAPTLAPLPAATVAPAALPTPTALPTPAVLPTPTAASEPAPASTDAPAATAVAEVVETPTPAPTPTAETATPVPTPTVEEIETGEEPTSVAETPTAVVASGELPVECYDGEIGVYRAYVDGVDTLSFNGGLVSCAGAGTNAVSAANSYRHSTGLIVQRNGDYIFDESGTAYIPYSGSLHFCMNGQPASAPVRAETVPALLIVIDNETQRQLAQGAIGPASFTGSGSQC